MGLRSLHRTSALLVFAFAFLHIANHLASLHSIELHIALMNALRKTYRQPVVEVLVLVCMACQSASGLLLVARAWPARVALVARLQVVSGLYLAFFLLVHVSAVLYGRRVLGLDTNFFFAAAGQHVPPFQWFFAPYYFLAVLALFVHAGCAAYRRFARLRPRIGRTLLACAVGAGLIVSVLLTGSLAGVFEDLHIPAAYRATFGAR